MDAGVASARTSTTALPFGLFALVKVLYTSPRAPMGDNPLNNNRANPPTTMKPDTSTRTLLRLFMDTPKTSLAHGGGGYHHRTAIFLGPNVQTPAAGSNPDLSALHIDRTRPVYRPI